MKRKRLLVIASLAVLTFMAGVMIASAGEDLTFNGNWEGESFKFSIKTAGAKATGSMEIKEEGSYQPNKCKINGTVKKDKLDFTFTCENAEDYRGLAGRGNPSKEGEGFVVVYFDEEMGGRWIAGGVRFGPDGPLVYVGCAKQPD